MQYMIEYYETALFYETLVENWQMRFWVFSVILSFCECSCNCVRCCY